MFTLFLFIEGYFTNHLELVRHLSFVQVKQKNYLLPLEPILLTLAMLLCMHLDFHH